MRCRPVYWKLSSFCPEIDTPIELFSDDRCFAGPFLGLPRERCDAASMGHQGWLSFEEIASMQGQLMRWWLRYKIEMRNDRISIGLCDNVSLYSPLQFAKSKYRTIHVYYFSIPRLFMYGTAHTLFQTEIHHSFLPSEEAAPEVQHPEAHTISPQSRSIPKEAREQRDDGIVPIKLLVAKFNSVNFVKRPISLGIVDVSAL